MEIWKRSSRKALLKKINAIVGQGDAAQFAKTWGFERTALYQFKNRLENGRPIGRQSEILGALGFRMRINPASASGDRFTLEHLHVTEDLIEK